MDRDELIFKEYELYSNQKENFINRNFRTNRFYMVSILALMLALIYTGNVVFLNKISASLIFAILGLSMSALWWMNVDSYNTIIKIKYANVIEKFEEKLPVQPFTDEYKGIEEFRGNKVFMFSDIQKLIAVFVALFFFAVCVNEIAPIMMAFIHKVVRVLVRIKGGM